MRKTMWQSQVRGLFLGGSLLVGAALLAGCSGGGDAPGGAVQAHAAQAGGKVMGGRQPVIGSTVTLYAVGNTGYSQATPLSPTTTTASDGTWNINFTCPSPGTEIYVVVTGGNAGGGTNANLALSAMFGPCGEPSNPLPTNANITEVTTVASAYALAQFLDSTGQMPGAPAANATGLANAIATLSSLVNLTTGQAQTAPVSGATATMPAATLNTLANLLASCVNTAGGTAGDGSACGSLFTDATPPGGTAPTTSLQAALDIALNPGNNATALYNLTSANGPYQTPAPLSAAPNDWTLAINFSKVSGAGVFDASGNFWYGVSAGIAEVNPNGVPAAGSPFDTGFTLGSVAIDASGHVWAVNSSANSGNGRIDELSASNGSLVGNYTSGGISHPGSIAIDASGNVWVFNSNSSFTELSAGASYAGTNYAPTGLASSGLGLSIVFDAGGNLWGESFNASKVYEFTLGGGVLAQDTGSPYARAQGVTGPAAIAVDPASHIWIADQSSPTNINGGNGALVELTSNGAGAAYTLTTLAGGGAYQPTGMAIDGAGTLWVADGPSPDGSTPTLQGVAVSKQGVGVAGSPFTGGGSFSYPNSVPQSVSIDRSGNVWVLRSNASTTELVGAAVPVSTPLLPPAS